MGRLPFRAVLLMLLLVYGFAPGSTQEMSYLESGLQQLYYYSVRIDDRFSQLNPTDNALQDFYQALGFGDEADEARLLLGLVYKSLEDLDGAFKHFQAFADEHPEELWVHALLGDIYLMQLDDQKAKYHYQAALAAGDSYARAHFGLARIALQRGEHHTATELLERSVDAAPEYVDALAALGHQYYLVGRYEEAYDHLQTANLHNPRRADIYHLLSLVYDVQGKVEQYEHARSRVLQLDPHFDVSAFTN